MRAEGAERPPLRCGLGPGAVVEREEQSSRAQGELGLQVGSGRIVASEIEAPNILVNLV